MNEQEYLEAIARTVYQGYIKDTTGVSRKWTEVDESERAIWRQTARRAIRRVAESGLLSQNAVRADDPEHLVAEGGEAQQQPAAVKGEGIKTHPVFDASLADPDSFFRQGTQQPLSRFVVRLPCISSAKERDPTEESSAIPAIQYLRWIDKHEPVSAQPRQQAVAKRIVSGPVVTVLVCGTSDRIDFTLQSLEALRGVSFEVIFCGGMQTVTTAELPSKSSGSLLAAIKEAKGEFLVAIEAGDRIPSYALEVVVEAARNDSQVDIVYADEDEIDDDGQRLNPYFKSDWSLDLFLSQEFAAHLCLVPTIRARRALEVSGLKARSFGEVLLAIVTATDAVTAVHIPYVLYHRRFERVVERPLISVFSKSMSKPPPAKAMLLNNGYRRIIWTLPEGKNDVCIIIPTRDRVSLLKNTVSSLQRNTIGIRWHAVIVDNGSEEEETLRFLADLARSDERFTVVRDNGEFNFSRLVNLGAAAPSESEYLCLLNNDIEVISPDWLLEMVRNCARQDVGAVGAMLFYADGTVQHAGCVLFNGVAQHIYKRFAADSSGHGCRLEVQQEYSAVSAACLVTRRDVWAAVGGFDENLKVSYNDIDFCLRVREQGFRIVWTPFAKLFHLESASRGSDKAGDNLVRLTAEKEYLVNKWPGITAPDPFYSPNLSFKALDCRLAFPPRIAPVG